MDTSSSSLPAGFCWFSRIHFLVPLKTITSFEDKGVRERFAGDRPGGDLVRPGEVRPDGDPVWPGGDRVRPGGDRVRPGEVRPGGDPVRPGGDPVRPGGDRHCSFRPCYPDRLWLEEEAFCNAFPFHIVFDEDLKVKQTGVNIQKFVPGLQMKDIRLDQYFTIMHPQVTFTIDSIKKFINSQFVLKMQTETIPQHRHTALKLRGQMVWMPSLACMLYLSSPKLRSLQELQERGLHLADIAPHDTTRDLILLNQQRLAEMELSNQLERKKGGREEEDAPHDTTRDLILLNQQRLAEMELSNQLERKKEELRVLSHHLAMEKQKTETLLYAMLPPHVANQLREGRRVEAAEFEVCTILFSDVVAFTSMCAACEPIRIVHMLNSMYSRFDRLTGVHGVYKVETIGDAYMVVGGVPVATASHAHRVANFALGMRLAAREVNNPVSGQPIQIRVGLHTGPVLAGVVGDKMPRYCLFGDTVNTASRMESQGVPDHIHLSPDTYTVLRGQGFDLQERGEIEVKGKGLMTTYFLYGNLLACEAAIMGRDGADSSSSSSLYTEKQPAQRPEPVSVHVTTKETCDWSPPASRKSSLDSLEGDAAEAVPAVPPYEWDITPPYRRDRGHSGSGDAIVHTRFCHLL
ncbi:Guanylate cyclase soluble subunit beta-2 [Merluccius polli]|uniref:guanylate cyclase n=1 Tax=Merluccius polli TaxID=89951 RepID=A0AA47MMW2_MERPO|nr:Guanylate cyclase soluble subunit beta-2 [Merluccius polli]